MRLVKFGLFSNIWLFLDLFSQKVRFQTKVFSFTSIWSFWVQNQTIFGPFFPWKVRFWTKIQEIQIIWEYWEWNLILVMFLNFQGITTDYFGQIQTFYWKSDQFWSFCPKKSDFGQKYEKIWLFGNIREGIEIWVVILTFSRHYRLIHRLSNSTGNKLIKRF